MAHRNLLSIVVAIAAFAAYLALYAALDGVGLREQREELSGLLVQAARIGGLIVAGVALLWATLLAVFLPGEYQLKPLLATAAGVLVWLIL